MEQHLHDLRIALGKRTKINATLATHTTFRIGGPADLLVEAKTISELIEYVHLARQQGVPIFILGNGSNLLVPDSGIRGLVIENHCGSFTLDVTNNKQAILHAESGVSLPGVTNRLSRQGWSGLEWAIGVPGTIGGAVVGNAGAHGRCMADQLLTVSILDENGLVRDIPNKEIEFGYRRSRFKNVKDEIILGADLEMVQATPQACIARMREYIEHRRQTQPSDPSIGSMFKNPPGRAAGELIDQAGLKGTRIGGVEVSKVHANFFVNRGNATALDVMQLIETVRERVRAQFNVELELEIEIVAHP